MGHQRVSAVVKSCNRRVNHSVVRLPPAVKAVNQSADRSLVTPPANAIPHYKLLQQMELFQMFLVEVIRLKVLRTVDHVQFTVAQFNNPP